MEWGVPQVEIYSLLYKYLKKLDERGEFIPDVAIAGGITLEDQIVISVSIGALLLQISGNCKIASCLAAMVERP